MHDLLAQIAEFIAANRGWAGPVVALLSFIECLALVGIVIPAPPLMVTLGGLIAGGMIDPLPVVGGAAFGAALGSYVSYLGGRWLGPGVVHRWPLNRFRTAVARSRLLFRRYAALAVFFCRFFGPLRCTVPLVAGVTGMNQNRFHLANTASAMLWAPALMAPGWIAATGMAQLENLGEAHWAAVTAAALASVALIVAIGFKIQRDRLAGQRRRKARRERQQRAAA